MRVMAVFSTIMLFSLFFSAPLYATDTAGDKARINEHIDNLEQRIFSLEQTRDYPSTVATGLDAAGLAMLFGAFCALWAQNTGRNALAWFFLGAFFNVLTLLALLIRNSRDIKEKSA